MDRPAGARIGYERVSTADQNLDLQHDALVAAGCVRIFTEKASGASADRPQLAALLEYVRPGDQVVVWRLDRLARSVRDLVDLVARLEAGGVQLHSVQERLDTASANGRLVFHVFAAVSQFERDLIRERTHAGLAAARARGRAPGRPTVMTPEKLAAAVSLHQAGQLTITQIAQQLGIGRSTLTKHLRQAREGSE